MRWYVQYIARNNGYCVGWGLTAVPEAEYSIVLCRLEMSHSAYGDEFSESVGGDIATTLCHTIQLIHRNM